MSRRNTRKSDSNAIVFFFMILLAIVILAIEHWRIILAIVAIAIFIILIIVIQDKNNFKAIKNSSIELSPKQFFELRKPKGTKTVVRAKDFAGVYVLHNETRNLHYVGQAQSVFDRVYQHFTGRGNGDVYADYKYGDKFTIRLFALDASDANSLDELERKLIAHYKANKNGYNKTAGNY